MHSPSPYYLEKITVKTVKQRGKMLGKTNLLAAKRLHEVVIAQVTSPGSATQLQVCQVSQADWIQGC